MATVNLLEDQITCSVCFDVYKNPHVLIGCLHTFCLECLERLETRNQIQCPECRHICHKKDVKKDFKLQGIVDIFYKQQVFEVSPLKCGKCLCQNEMVKFHCAECRQFLCHDCQQKHTTTKTYKKHSIKNVHEITKSLKTKFRELLDECEKEKWKIEQNYVDLDKRIWEIEKIEVQQLSEVAQYTEEAIREMKENQRRIDSTIKEANRTFIRNLQGSRELHVKYKGEIQKKIDFLNDLMKGQDINTLMEFSENIKDSLRESIKKIKNSLPIVTLVQSPVSIKKGENWNVNSYIEIQVDQSGETKAALPALYSNMFRKEYALAGSIDLDYFPRKLHFIKQDVWCCGNDKISVHNKHCEPVKEITHHEINGITGMTLNDSDDIIVACGFNKGLHQLDIAGKYQRQIVAGSFSDVCTNGEKLHALEYRNCSVYVCAYPYEWINTKKISLHYNQGSAYDKLCLSNDNIFVSSEYDKCIYKYNFDGQLQQEIKDVCNEIHICGVDGGRDNILIADYRNHQIKVCDMDGNWHVISTSERLCKPIHVIVDDDGIMWVANFSNKKVQKFIPK